MARVVREHRRPGPDGHGVAPSVPSGSTDVRSADHPDPSRFWLLVALTVLVTTGSFIAYTYLAPFFVAPGSVNLAAAIISTAVNVGISAGALCGGLLLSATGARSTVLVAGILSTAAFALARRESSGRRRV